MSGFGGKADIGGAWRGASLGAPSSAGPVVVVVVAGAVRDHAAPLAVPVPLRGDRRRRFGFHIALDVIG